MADDRPLTTEEWRAALAAVVAPGASGLVVAVSGGPDSMALMHGIATLASEGALPAITIGTVDHGLRDGSGQVAGQVRAAAEALGLPCRVMPWLGDKPASGLQAAARAARYALLQALCADLGADHLLTAHTADDQAETVLMRLARGSGVAGLAAMRGRSRLGDVTLARPLLGFAKARLLGTCRALGIDADADPANTDPRFERARLRGAALLLEAAGVGRAALVRLAERSARANDALEALAREAYGRARVPGGLRLGTLAAGHPEILVRALGMSVAAAGGRPGRLSRLETAAARLATATREGAALRLSLGGAVLSLDRTGTLEVSREGARRRGRGSSFTLSSDPGRAPPQGVVSWQG